MTAKHGCKLIGTSGVKNVRLFINVQPVASSDSSQNKKLKPSSPRRSLKQKEPKTHIPRLGLKSLFECRVEYSRRRTEDVRLARVEEVDKIRFIAQISKTWPVLTAPSELATNRSNPGSP